MTWKQQWVQALYCQCVSCACVTLWYDMWHIVHVSAVIDCWSHDFNCFAFHLDLNINNKNCPSNLESKCQKAVLSCLLSQQTTRVNTKMQKGKRAGTCGYSCGAICYIVFLNWNLYPWRGRRPTLPSSTLELVQILVLLLFGKASMIFNSYTIEFIHFKMPDIVKCTYKYLNILESWGKIVNWRLAYAMNWVQSQPGLQGICKLSWVIVERPCLKINKWQTFFRIYSTLGYLHYLTNNRWGLEVQCQFPAPRKESMEWNTTNEDHSNILQHGWALRTFYEVE